MTRLVPALRQHLAHRRLSRAALLLAALAATACSGPEAPLSEQQSGIFGGAPAPDDAAVVAVVNFAGGQCSGSLIAPNLVLTARHCVAKTAKQDVQVICGQTEFEPPDSAGAVFVVPLPNISENPDDYLAVGEIRMPQGVDADLCGTDVVLLRLKQPLGGVTPLNPRLDPVVATGESYSAVGYGLDESLPDKPSSERKRLDDLDVACADPSCRGDDVRDNEWIGSGGPCQGDSGGPALDDEGRVIGVVSRGKAGCTEPVFSDVASRGAWLSAEAVRAADAAHLSPPDWACHAGTPCHDEPDATCSFAPASSHAAGWSVALTALGLLAWCSRRLRQT